MDKWKQPAKYQWLLCVELQEPHNLDLISHLVFLLFFILSHISYDVTVSAAKSSISSDASGHYLLIIWVNLLHQIGGHLMNSWHNNLARKLVNRDWFLEEVSCYKWMQTDCTQRFNIEAPWIKWFLQER